MGEWTHVEDKLPATYTAVWVYCEDGTVTLGFRSDFGWYDHLTHDGVGEYYAELHGVTYWKPLTYPQPPERA
jgi:hypothetical protein